MSKQDEPRSIEKVIEIDAPIEAVWKALTEAEELTNWFPPNAEIKPGKGGFVRVIWGEKQDWTSPIEVWKPNEHLRLIYVEATPEEQRADSLFVIPFRVAVDYYLESKGGKTILRLVHSGFSRDATWDAQYDGTVTGWDFELGGLRHYLEYHRGKKRRIAHAHRVINEVPIEEAWKKIMGPDGLNALGAIEKLSPGDRYAFSTASGDQLRGIARIVSPPKGFVATDEALGNAYLRVRIDEACITSPNREAHLWLSLFGGEDAQPRAMEIENRWQKMLDGLFDAAAT